MQHFVDTSDLLKFAAQKVNERISALEKDVNHCIESEPYAPIPAISYCFSTTNFLGELSIRPRPGKGNDSGHRTMEYMQKFMNYSTDDSKMLLDVFRHKIVHLGIPQPLTKDPSGKVATWVYFHQQTGHMQKIQASTGDLFTVKQGWQIPYDYVFVISIKQFMLDIKKSVEDPTTGYLAKLQTDGILQANFEKAITEIYTPA